MYITARIGEPLQFPLHTIFTLDLTEILQDQTGYYWQFVDAEGNSTQENARFRFQSTGENSNIYIVSENSEWQPENWNGDPENIPGPTTELRIYNFITQETTSLTYLPALDRLEEPADIRGTAGRDVMMYDGNDTEMTRIHLVDTSGGSDHAEFVNASGIMLGRSGNDTLIGWNGNDALYGGGDNDRLEGRAGADVLHGINGNDSLFGGDGNDVVYGGNGNDIVTGGNGDDVLYTGTGNDTARGEDGNDNIYIKGVDTLTAMTATSVVFGGNGDDYVGMERTGMEGRLGLSSRMPIFEGENHTGQVTVSTGAGDDSVYLYSTSGGTINTGDDNDNLSAGVGNHSNGTLNIILGAGNDSGYGGKNTNIFGGSGNDDIYITGGSQASGGDGDDEISVTQRYDEELGEYIDAGSLVFGGLGDDVIYGGAGNDTLHGGDGLDFIQANRGNNFLYGGNGDDTINGGQGADWISGGNDDDVLYASDGGFNFENDDATNFNDTVNGGAGNDQLFADRTGHSLFGGSGDDLLRVNIDRAADGGDSLLFGGSGNDMIAANGRSVVSGGEGQDTFNVDIRENGFGYTEENIMIITDFTQGEDLLNIQHNLGNHWDLINSGYQIRFTESTNEEFGAFTAVTVVNTQDILDTETVFILQGNSYLSMTDFVAPPMIPII